MDISWKIWYLLLFISNLWFRSSGDSLAWTEQCKPYTRSEPVQIIQADADIFLNSLLDVHQTSRRGIYGCGKINERSVIIFEAMRWLISIINQDKGYLNGYRITESLIPGIKLGMKVYDTCNHPELGTNYITKIYPVLERGSDDCEDNAPLDLNSLSLIDMVGVSKDSRIMALSRHYHLPIVLLNLNLFIPPEMIAETLTQVISDLKWNQIAILHTLEEHSLQILKLLGQASLKDQFCMTFIQSLPLPSSSSSGEATTSKSDSNYISALKTLVTTLPENIPIFVITNDATVKRLFTVMSARLELISRHQWLFASMPDPEILKPFHNSSVNFFTLSPYPGLIEPFEGYWQPLKNGDISADYSWLDEYLLTERSQLKDGGAAAGIHAAVDFGESPIEMLWRTYQVTPMIHTMFILAQGLRQAWLNKCAGIPGLCRELVKMTRKEFETDYLGDLRFEDKTFRELREIRLGGTKKPMTGDWIHLAVTKLLFNDIYGVGYRHMIAYDSATGKRHIIDAYVPYKSSPCPPTGCQGCVKVRQSRIVDNQSLDSVPSSSSTKFEILRDDEDLINNSQVERECMARCAWEAEHGLMVSKSSNEDTWETRLEQIHIPAGWYLTLTVISALGVILIIMGSFYFRLVFPTSSGTTLLGYMTLLGVMAIFSVNFSYLIPSSFSVCVLRRIGMSLAYSIILSSLLVKVINIRRYNLLGGESSEKLRISTPLRLLSVALLLLSLQIIVTLIWLIIIPPKPNLELNTCSWPANDSLIIRTESLVSLVYIVILVLCNIIFSLFAWNNMENYREPRWIFSTCLLMTFIWSVWSLATTYSPLFRSHSNLTIVCANILSALVILMCLYVRKLKIYLRAPMKSKKGRTSSQLGLHNSSFSGSYYGTLPKSQKLAISLFNNGQGSYFRPGNSSRRSTLSTSFFIPWNPNFKGGGGGDHHSDDGQSSCASTSGSIQVQAEDLYPMDVYEDADSVQPYHYYSTHQ